MKLEEYVESRRLKKIVELFVLEHEGFFGLIVPMITGITWSNQTGGTLCNHPELEGIFVPLPPDWFKSNSIKNEYGISGPFSFAENAKIVEKFLKANPEVEQRFEIDPKSEIRAHEAWVPVRVKERERGVNDWDVLAPFYGQSGILTYPNSD